jgi:hypothetical protein
MEKTNFVIDHEKMDAHLAEGASSPGIRTLLIDSFKNLQSLGIIKKVCQECGAYAGELHAKECSHYPTPEHSKSEPAPSPALPT